MIKRSENINLNYAAKCVQCSSISPIKGADRVVAARFGAVTCVIDKSWRQGDQAVFFPPESVICDKILHGLSLYADSSLNLDPNQKGYFNERGRVKALRLRDIMSEGFVLRIDQIRSIYPNFVFEQDELFDMVWDEKIVWKYVVPKKEPVVREQVSQRWWKKSMKRLKRFSRIIPGQFAFHYDTGQLRDYLHKFTPDTQITVTAKCHGCVERNTIVNTQEFGDLTIGEIVDKKVDCHIKAYDTEAQLIVYVPIDQFYTIPNDGEWYDIELKNGQTITITGNNPVWCENLQCYRRVDELDGSEVLLFDK